MMNKLPNGAQQALSQLESCGYEAYMVGGCVRDMLLGVEPNDYDITTNALPEQTMRCFSQYHVLETGIQHGTVTVIIENMPIEITTYRIDGAYSDNRRPDNVVFTRSLREDLARRDFTINAMAYNPTTGIQDFFDGQTDLKNQCIRCVGEPSKRFQEDALRIVRAVRFSSTLGFSIETQTAQALYSTRGLMIHIARERVRTELDKLLLGKDVQRVLLDYAEIICEIIPEIIPCIGFAQHSKYHMYNVWEHTVHTVAASSESIVIRLTMLLHDLAKPHCFSVEDGTGHFYNHQVKSADIAKGILKRLRYSNEMVDKVTTLIRYHSVEFNGSPKAIKRWMSKLGEQTIRELLMVQRADLFGKNTSYWHQFDEISECEKIVDEIIVQSQCFTIKQLAVDGNDLKTIGCTQGREIGQVLTYLLDQVIEHGCPNQSEVLLQKAKQYILI